MSRTPPQLCHIENDHPATNAFLRTLKLGLLLALLEQGILTDSQYRQARERLS